MRFSFFRYYSNKYLFPFLQGKVVQQRQHKQVQEIQEEKHPQEEPLEQGGHHHHQQQQKQQEQQESVPTTEDDPRLSPWRASEDILKTRRLIRAKRPALVGLVEVVVAQQQQGEDGDDSDDRGFPLADDSARDDAEEKPTLQVPTDPPLGSIWQASEDILKTRRMMRVKRPLARQQGDNDDSDDRGFPLADDGEEEKSTLQVRADPPLGSIWRASEDILKTRRMIRTKRPLARQQGDDDDSDDRGFPLADDGEEEKATLQVTTDPPLGSIWVRVGDRLLRRSARLQSLTLL